MRMTICRSSWLVALCAGALSAPAALSAQDPTPPAPPTPAADTARTHIVRPGDTLWEIARIYLGDPFLWPEIYRVNTVVIEDPHWIFPGEALVIPSGVGAPTVVAQAPQDTTVIPQTQDQPQLIFAPVNRDFEGPTVFARPPQRTTATPSIQGPQEQPRTAVRLGEFRAAPWVDRDGGPRGNGRIVATTEIPGIPEMSEKIRYSFNERLYILPPEQITPRPGDRYLTYRPGPEIPGVGQVMIPTGIVQVERAYAGEKVASVARLVAQYDVVMEGDGVMPLEPFVMDSTSRVAPEDLGVTGRVVWIQGEPVLPTLQRYVVVDASARDGVRVGDQLTLVRPTTETHGGVTLPEQEIAQAQVVRVTSYGVTAIILDQTQPAIRPGTFARVTGRLR